MAVHFANKGRSLVTVSAKGEFKVWDPKKGREIGGYIEDLEVTGTTLCDDKHVVFVAGSTIGSIDAKKGKFQGSVAFVPEVTQSVCYIPKYRWIYVGYRDGTMRRMPSELATESDIWGTGASHILAMGAHPKGERLIAGTDKGTLLIIDPTELELLEDLEVHEGAVAAIAFHPKGKTFYSAGVDKSVRFFDLETRREFGRVDLKNPATALAITPKGDGLAIGDEGGVVYLWKTTEQQMAVTYEDESKSPVRGLAFDAKGKELAVAGFGKHVTLLDVAPWKLK